MTDDNAADPFAWCPHLRDRTVGTGDRYRHTGLHTEERIGWLLERAARRWPDREALCFEGRRLTFGQLNSWVTAVAGDLVEAGVGAGDRILWQLPNCLEGLALHFAGWRIGAVCVPVVPVYRQHEMRSILDQAQPAVVAFDAGTADRRPAAEADALLAELDIVPRLRLAIGEPPAGWGSIRASDRPSGGHVQLPDPSPADDPSLVLFTSGTTSAPKGAVHAGRALLAEAATWRDIVGLHHDDVFLMGAPITHIAGLLTAVIVPAVLGARTVLMPAWDPKKAMQLASEEHATFSAGATVFLQAFVDHYERDEAAPRLRGFIAGGSSVPAALIARADELGTRALRSWGMTEAPSVTLADLSDPVQRRSNYDGRLSEGAECEAVDEDRRPLPRGAAGELRVRCPEQMLGYLNPEVDEAQVDADGWFYTGDVGVVDENGWVLMTGRIKDIVNRGGEKFSAQDIEGAISAHPAVASAAVVGTPEPRLGEQVTAFVVLRVGHEWPGQNELRRHLDALGLARPKFPVAWRVLEELPMTLSGKIKKHELLGRVAVRPGCTARARVAPTFT